jgi:THO complex subunit 2
LDPNRTLDLLLGLFIEGVETHFSFYLALLAKSPWTVGAKDGNDSQLASTSIANLIGFRLRAISNDSARRSTQRTMNVVALLIKNGFIDLSDLYEHLSPADETLETVMQQKLDAEASKAQSLGQISLGPKKTKNEDEAKKPEQNQKAMLCESLFMVGDLNNAKTLLMRFPKMVALRPTIVVQACRCLHYLIEPVFAGYAA